MKVNITFNNKSNKSGYVNLDPTRGDDIFNLTSHEIDDAECLEILVEDCLEYVPHKEAVGAIHGWVSKLRHGGKIGISLTDCNEIFKAGFNKSASQDDLRTLLFGSQQEEWDHKVNQFTVEEVVSILTSLNLKITKRRINAFKMYVEAERE